MDIDMATEPLGHGSDGQPILLADIWPKTAEVHDVIARSLSADMFSNAYRNVFGGGQRWRDIDVANSELFPWDEASTYIRRPPYLDGVQLEAPPIGDIHRARVLVKLGDLVTTDHISPAGAITLGTPAWEFLAARGVSRRDMNTYASRRGNHEVMMRGAFANLRLKNQVAPGTRGGHTRNFLAGGSETTIFDAAAAYREAKVPMVVVAGRDYGGGSSRDWAAKGPALIGVRAVIAQSFERIHRTNLVAMGVIPIELVDVQPDDVAPTGAEEISITGLDALNSGETPSHVTIHSNGNSFAARLRLDTPRETDYVRHGGVMPYVLRDLFKSASSDGAVGD
jgi:aconitate hydratase